MISVKDFRECVIQPTLGHLDMYSLAAENLLIGTAVQESGLRHLRQMGKGPALGLYQIEPATHEDIWDNFFKYRPSLENKLRDLLGDNVGVTSEHQLITNLVYATAIARLIYYRVSEPLPDADDVDALAVYWKEYYNTRLGKGTTPAFKLNYLEHCNG